MREQTKRFLEAVAILVGTIVGVGMFGIPHVVGRAGLPVGILHLIVLTAAILAIHTVYGEIVLRTRAKHRLIGYAQMYLGGKGKLLAIFLMLAGISGTLLAYIIVGGMFTKAFVEPLLRPTLDFSLPAALWSVIFFSAMAFFIVTDFRTGAPAELAMSAALIAALGYLIVRFLPDVNIANLIAIGKVRDALLPYGVVFFALSGSAAIPELRDVLSGDGQMRSAIVIGTLIPAILYGLFALSVVGVFGNTVAEDAISTLAGRYGNGMSVLGGLVGILMTATSYIVLALVLKHAFIADLNVSPRAATLLVLGIPLALFLIATRNFVAIIGFIGGVLGGIEGLLLLAIHRAAKEKSERQPEYAIALSPLRYWALGAVFIAGIGYEIFHALRLWGP